MAALLPDLDRCKSMLASHPAVCVYAAEDNGLGLRYEGFDGKNPLAVLVHGIANRDRTIPPGWTIGPSNYPEEWKGLADALSTEAAKRGLALSCAVPTTPELQADISDDTVLAGFLGGSVIVTLVDV